MGTAASEGPLKFKVHPPSREHKPPHVHVWWQRKVELCQIELNSGRFMYKPPPGMGRRIAETYARHIVAIREEWARLHEA